MILSRLSDYLREHRRASLADLAHAVGAAAEALEPMLATLERKGRVRRLPAGSGCGRACSGCDPSTQVVYEWAGEDHAARGLPVLHSEDILHGERAVEILHAGARYRLSVTSTGKLILTK